MGLFAASASASSFTITPTWDSTISSLPNAATIEATINTAIGIYEAAFSDPINVNITFKDITSGLGQSSFTLFDIPYATFDAALKNDQITPNDATAVAHISSCPVPVNPSTCTNPVTGTTDVLIKSANAAALGVDLTALHYTLPASDGTIGLNTSLTNLSRTGPRNSSLYDLQSVAMHEIDEILGLGSTLGLNFTGANSGFNNVPSPEDFFRYTSLGARSFTSATNALAYFSINGTTDLAQFNNTGSGDYGDWASSATPQVQDAFGTPGAQANLGVELTALDVIGYDSAVPEPSTLSLLGASLIFAVFLERSRRSKSRV